MARWSPPDSITAPTLQKDYDQESFALALAESERGWSIALKGESITDVPSDGTLLGGCLNLIETTIGTHWEFDTHGAILILEDRGMKPWQVDEH